MPGGAERRPAAISGPGRRAVCAAGLAGLAALATAAIARPARAQDDGGDGGDGRDGIAPPRPAEPSRLALASLLLAGARAGDRLVAVGQRGHVLISDDAGRTWSQRPCPTRAALTAVAFADARTGWAAGHDATILKTTDGGENWVLQHRAPRWEQPVLALAADGPDRAWAVGAYGLFLATGDGGATWQERLVTDLDYHFYDIARLADGTWMMAGEFGGLYAATDPDGAWTVLDSPYEGSFFGAVPLPGGGAMIHGLVGHVFRRAAPEAAWRAVPSGVEAGLLGGTALPDGRVVLVGRSGTVLTAPTPEAPLVAERLPDRDALAAVLPAPDGGLILLGETGARRVPRLDAGTPIATERPRLAAAGGGW
ncbi:MAG: YCF48-related protein [Azospirillaceae bacterium]